MSSGVILPDSKQCWLVALSAGWYVFFSMATVKSASVLYVGSIDMLNLTREEASWPATMAVMVSQLAGPVYGVLLRWCSERSLLLLGALACSLSVMASAASQDVITLSILIGIIYGFGCACSEVLPYVILTRHFERYRGTVISLLYILTAVSGFLMPIVAEFLRQTYGFRTCLLLMGAINLNMFVGCIVVNRVDWLTAATASSSNSSGDLCGAGRNDAEVTKDDVENDVETIKARIAAGAAESIRCGRTSVCSAQTYRSIAARSHISGHVTSPGPHYYPNINYSSRYSSRRPSFSCSESFVVSSLALSRSSFGGNRHPVWDMEREDHAASSAHDGEHTPLLKHSVEEQNIDDDVERATKQRSKSPLGWWTVLTENCKEIISANFIHITLSRAVTVFLMATFVLILLDLGTDKGLDAFQGLSLVTAFSIGDLISRVLAGWAIDANVLSCAAAMAISLFFQGIGFFIVTYCSIYWMLLFGCLLVGVFGGGRNIVCTVLVTDEFSMESLAFNLGVMNFFTGVTFFFQPSLIGYVRDILGTYESMLATFGVLNIIFTFTWTIKVIIDYRRHLLRNM